MTSDNRVRHDLRHLRILAFAFFNRPQRLTVQLLRPRLVLGKEARRLRIQVPAVIIELRLLRHHLHADGPPLFHVQKPDDYVRHLHARIVNVILNLHAVPRVPQDSHHRVAQHRVPNVPDVRRLIRIDARMLHNDFVGQAFLPVVLPICCAAARFFLNLDQKVSPVEIRIQISAARHLDSGDPLDLAQTIRNLLRNLPRCALQPFRQFKTHRRSRLPHLNLRRPLQNNR